MRRQACTTSKAGRWQERFIIISTSSRRQQDEARMSGRPPLSVSVCLPACLTLPLGTSPLVLVVVLVCVQLVDVPGLTRMQHLVPSEGRILRLLLRTHTSSRPASPVLGLRELLLLLAERGGRVRAVVVEGGAVEVVVDGLHRRILLVEHTNPHPPTTTRSTTRIPTQPAQQQAGRGSTAATEGGGGGGWLALTLTQWAQSVHVIHTYTTSTTSHHQQPTPPLLPLSPCLPPRRHERLRASSVACPVKASLFLTYLGELAGRVP